MTDFLNFKDSQKQIICPKHGTHKHYISSTVENYEGDWCMPCWLESLGPSLLSLSNQMTDTRFDHLWNLIDGLSDRIRDLETEVRGLGYRANKTENEIDKLNNKLSQSND